MTLATTQTLPTLTVGTEASCQKRYTGTLFGLSFARDLNDTPKIEAMLLVGGTLSLLAALVGVAIVMAMGGLLNTPSEWRKPCPIGYRDESGPRVHGQPGHLHHCHPGLQTRVTGVNCLCLVWRTVWDWHGDATSPISLAAAFGALGFFALNRWLVT